MLQTGYYYCSDITFAGFYSVFPSRTDWTLLQQLASGPAWTLDSHELVANYGTPWRLMVSVAAS